MAATLLFAEDRGDREGIYFQVHIDKTKVLGDGSPDPDWIREYTFPSYASYNSVAPFDSGSPILGRPAGETKAQYRQRCRTEAKGLALAEASRLDKSGNSRLTQLEGDL